jgi:hypothetical protein
VLRLDIDGGRAAQPQWLSDTIPSLQEYGMRIAFIGKKLVSLAHPK